MVYIILFLQYTCISGGSSAFRPEEIRGNQMKRKDLKGTICVHATISGIA